MLPDRTDFEGQVQSPLQRVLTAASVFTVCCALVLLMLWRSPVRFQSEMIRVTVDPERITVNGIYRLYNRLPFPTTQPIFYPTPEEGGLEPVDQLVLERLPDGPGSGPERLNAIKGGNPGYYRVSVPGRRTVEVRVRYSQRHEGGRGRYILTTTAGWGRPLRQASFELILRSLDIVESNYRLTDQGDGRWTFNRTDFMPVEDWVFTFRSRSGVS